MTTTLAGLVVALSLTPDATPQTSGLTKQQIHEVWRANLGSFPRDPNEEKALVQQLEAINAKGQQVINCYYGVPGQIYAYTFWHKSAPEGIRQILKSPRSGQEHPFWTLGVNAIDTCPATRQTARKLLADSRAGALSTPALPAASVPPTPAQAVTLLKVAPPKIKDVAPLHPERFRHIKASLVFAITIGPDGRMTDAVLDNQGTVGPYTLFWDSTIAAMRQWVYNVNGLKPPVKFRVTIPFGIAAPPAVPAPPSPSSAGATRQTRVEDQLKAVVTRLLREAPTRFAVLRGDRIQIQVNKTVISGSRSIILAENPGPIVGDATIFDLPANKDFANGSSLHHLRYTPSGPDEGAVRSEFLRFKNVIDDVVPADWERGGRGASEDKARWSVECTGNNKNIIEITLDSRPSDALGWVPRPKGPAIDLELIAIPCEGQ